MYGKSFINQPVLVFADPPLLSQLCAINVELGKQTTLQCNTLQPHILKCREIIFTEPSVIAAPSVDANTVFHVVMQQSTYKSGRLQARFHKIGLQPSKPIMVTPAMFQACLKYTLFARIAPNWNKAGEWLIQGRDFLTSSPYTNAVKMDLTVNKDEMFFAIDASAVCFQGIKTEDLDIVGKKIQQFHSNHEVDIIQSDIGSPWCFVLPSMKKGRIVNISHQLPADGPFQSYKDLKRHWKNTYGYRLPDSEEDVIFYQIHFRPLAGRTFTYPEVCLRTRSIQRVSRVDPKPILSAFLHDVQSKMPSICGSILHLQNRAKCPIVGLSNPMALKATTPNNLANIPAPTKSIYRTPAEIRTLFNKDSTSGSLQENGSVRISRDTNVSQVEYHEKSRKFSTSYSTEQERSKLINTTSAMFSNAAARMDENTVPIQNPYDPVVRNMLTVSEPSTTTSIQKMVPRFNTTKINTVSKLSINTNTVNENRVIPVFKQKKAVIPSNNNKTLAPKNKNTANAINGKLTTYSNFCQSSDNSCDEIAKTSSQLITTVDSLPYACPKPQLPSFPKRPLNPIGCTTPKTFVAQTTPIRPSLPLAVHMSTTPKANTKKKLADDKEGTPVAKKQRVKPQIQDDIDVERLATHNQLHKVNAVTLIAWLKERGIQCKSKDKKADLQEKVRNVIGLVAEQ